MDADRGGTEMNPRPVRGMTERRRLMLEAVQDGRVSYDAREARWLIDEEPVVKWDWRTLGELRNTGWISAGIRKDRSVTLARLTREGRNVLAAAEAEAI